MLIWSRKVFEIMHLVWMQNETEQKAKWNKKKYNQKRIIIKYPAILFLSGGILAIKLAFVCFFRFCYFSLPFFFWLNETKKLRTKLVWWKQDFNCIWLHTIMFLLFCFEFSWKKKKSFGYFIQFFLLMSGCRILNKTKTEFIQYKPFCYFSDRFSTIQMF